MNESLRGDCPPGGGWSETQGQFLPLVTLKMPVFNVFSQEGSVPGL